MQLAQDTDKMFSLAHVVFCTRLTATEKVARIVLYVMQRAAENPEGFLPCCLSRYRKVLRNGLSLRCLTQLARIAFRTVTFHGQMAGNTCEPFTGCFDFHYHAPASADLHTVLSVTYRVKVWRFRFLRFHPLFLRSTQKERAFFLRSCDIWNVPGPFSIYGYAAPQGFAGPFVCKRIMRIQAWPVSAYVLCI